MGALMFFLMFILLILICNVLVQVLENLGFWGSLEDPKEWDMVQDNDDNIENGYDIEELLLLNENEQRHCVNE